MITNCEVPGVPTCTKPRKQLYIIEADDYEEVLVEEMGSDKEDEAEHHISVHALTGIPSYSTMRGNWFTTEVLLLPLESYDMILGVQWLLPLNDILWNFQKMTMKFELAGKSYELKGLQNNLFAVCSLEKVDKHARTGDLQLFSLHLTNGEHGDNYHSRVVNFPSEQEGANRWKELVAQFPQVFQVPTGLPPQRQFNHKIVLKEAGARKTTVNIWNGSLRCCKPTSFFAKESKCVFGGRAIEYLGHIIAKEGVSTDPKKIEAVQQWPIPKTVKQLQGFLGLAWYYRRFIHSFGMITRPLTDLLKKHAFKWGMEAQNAFDSLKSALTSAPVLTLPDPAKQFVIETDASAGGIGAVLMQDRHPISFLSRALSPRQNALSVYEKELLAIMLAVKQWHYYLVTGPFVIHTDQKSLKQ
ncbi:uncharacterized protein LOC143622102 [Bidens hawaiensis]|uniref:uncharacterized protein LOC143622102 n=1 Tax=Bidens hawaiensis TaxID=980011 RepID=UPI004049FC9A